MSLDCGTNLGDQKMQTPHRKGLGTQGIQSRFHEEPAQSTASLCCHQILLNMEYVQKSRFTFQFVCWETQSASGFLSPFETLSQRPGTASHSDSSWCFFLPCKPPRLLLQMTQQRPPQPDQRYGLRACCWESQRQYDAQQEQPDVCGASLGSLSVCLLWLPCSGCVFEWAQHTDQEIYLLVGPQPWSVLLVPPAIFPVLRKHNQVVKYRGLIAYFCHQLHIKW